MIEYDESMNRSSFHKYITRTHFDIDFVQKYAVLVYQWTTFRHKLRKQQNLEKTWLNIEKNYLMALKIVRLGSYSNTTQPRHMT